MSNILPCKYRDPLTGLYCPNTPTQQTGFCDDHAHLGYQGDFRCRAEDLDQSDGTKKYRCWRKVASADTTLCSVHRGA